MNNPFIKYVKPKMEKQVDLIILMDSAMLPSASIFSFSVPV